VPCHKNPVRLMNKKHSRFITAGLALISAGLLLAGLKFPLWQMRMESPQYREEEAIKVAVYPGALRGDIKEIETLNQYIGVRIPRELPQCRWLPGALIIAAVLGVIGALLPRSLRQWALVVVPAALSISLLVGAVQARQQMYEIGHHRNEKTPLRGVKDFTPPFLGKEKLFQFDVASWFGAGAYLIAGAVALQISGACLSRKAKQPCGEVKQVTRPAASDTKEALA
jgi:copper chaperone NosL